MSIQTATNGKPHDFRIYTTRVNIGDLNSIIEKLLPDQGCIEVQRDVSLKEHNWHKHGVDETLVILEGELEFYWDAGRQIASPGTVISIPAGMKHRSVAQEQGATYLIAFDKVDLA